ncbi:MAG: hypothetical protein NZM12_14015, partial [Steroidobacteraceae bacterium]|nr:hypothetical protein [Steroidobacteraceae bacterium]
RILFTPNFAARDEYAAALAHGYGVTLDNLDILRAWGELFRDRAVFVRVDPGVGRGHHAHVRTAGASAKFGVPIEQMAELPPLLARSGARVVGLHAHVGSGIFDVRAWAQTAAVLAAQAERLPDVRVLNLGGGLGVPERAGRAPLDLAALDAVLAQQRERNARWEYWLEPGRLLVAEAGVLLARVTQTKRKGDVTYIGIATGMNSLIRPALYGAHHDIVNLSRLEASCTERVNVVGPICESADYLGHDRFLPPTEIGDVLLIATAGAYGRVMASQYNLREPAVELAL